LRRVARGFSPAHPRALSGATLGVNRKAFYPYFPPQESAPTPERVLKGEPKTWVRNYYTDPSQQFFAGTWASNVGKWQVEYTEHEFCHLLEGRVVLTSADGRRWQFNAGDAWVIPAGFSGTWETVEPARKRYASFEVSKPA
jgi:uncharacterized cupin superfamily protein